MLKTHVHMRHIYVLAHAYEVVENSCKSKENRCIVCAKTHVHMRHIYVLAHAYEALLSDLASCTC